MDIKKEIALLKKMHNEMKNVHLEQIQKFEKELTTTISHYYVLMSENETFSHEEAKAIKEKTSLRVNDIIDYINNLYQSNNKLVELIEILNKQNQERF